MAEQQHDHGGAPPPEAPDAPGVPEVPEVPTIEEIHRTAHGIKDEAAAVRAALTEPLAKLARLEQMADALATATHPREEPPPPVEEPDPEPEPEEPELPRVVVSRVAPGHKSARVFFDPFPGAADYAVRDPADPSWVKYSQGGWSCQVNDPPARVVVEALDRLGPYRDERRGHPHGPMILNGGGEPDAVPVVLARSAPVALATRPHPYEGHPDLAFFDDHGSGDACEERPFPADWVTPGVKIGPFAERYVLRTPKMDFYAYSVDKSGTETFVHKGHRMTRLVDGPTGAPGNNYGCLMGVPRGDAFVLAEGGYVEWTMAVDADTDGRRWLEWLLWQDGDAVTRPNALREVLQDHPTGPKGRRCLNVVIDGSRFNVGVLDPDPRGGVGRVYAAYGPKDWEEWPAGSGLYPGWREVPVGNRNGRNEPRPPESEAGHVDNRSRFTFRVTQTRCRIEEETPRGEVHAYELDYRHAPLPPGRYRCGAIHMAYHLQLGLNENRQNAPQETFLIRRTPGHDTRHWGAFGMLAGKGVL